MRVITTLSACRIRGRRAVRPAFRALDLRRILDVFAQRDASRRLARAMQWAFGMTTVPPQIFSRALLLLVLVAASSVITTSRASAQLGDFKIAAVSYEYYPYAHSKPSEQNPEAGDVALEVEGAYSVIKVGLAATVHWTRWIRSKLYGGAAASRRFEVFVDDVSQGDLAVSTGPYAGIELAFGPSGWKSDNPPD